MRSWLTNLLRHARSEHLLRVGLALMVAVATILLCVGERSIVLSLLTFLALGLSAYLTDYKKVFYLKQSVADMLALAIMAASAVATMYVDRHGQLLLVADLQSYLQYVLLFQRKSVRVYWQLALLSLGQMAIASTLVPGPLFGVLLLAYMFLGIITFSQLLVMGESRHVAPPAVDRENTSAKSSRADLRPRLVGKQAPAEPLATLRGLAEQAAWICLVTVLTSIPLFLILPRWAVANREVETNEPLRTVGFSKTVTLGELGEVVNNPDLVMRIAFFRKHENRAFRLAGEPLLRGTVVTRYEDGVWKQGRMGNSTHIASPEDTYTRFVRQRITAEPLDVGELFCVFPIFPLRYDTKLRTNSSRDQLLRQEDVRGGQFECEIGTTAIVGDRQREIVPQRRISNRERADLLTMDSSNAATTDRFVGLRATAAQVLRDAGIDPQQQRAEAARALSNYLRTSRLFSYSLDAQARNPGLDPIEDFVTVHRRGHCEYFAGALVMMLRSQDIPARMAIGFKGGEWNPLGQYYQIQQLHAHTWVEVYLDHDDIPADAFDAEDGDPVAAWLMLDPTTGTVEGDGVTQGSGLMARMRQSVDYAQVLWNNYVVGYGERRQSQDIYEPLALAVDGAVETVVSPEAWSARFRALDDSALGTFWHWYKRHWFSWRGGLVAVGFSLGIVGCYLGTRWLLRFLGKWGLVGKRVGPDERPVLEIYRRLEAALAHRGLRRLPAQTAYEFAVVAGGELAEEAADRRVAHLPRHVVEAFYRVRFGGHALDNVEAEAVEHALAELESALVPRR